MVISLQTMSKSNMVNAPHCCILINKVMDRLMSSIHDKNCLEYVAQRIESSASYKSITNVILYSLIDQLDLDWETSIFLNSLRQMAR